MVVYALFGVCFRGFFRFVAVGRLGFAAAYLLNGLGYLPGGPPGLGVYDFPEKHRPVERCLCHP
jgi:hypothetical protein